VKLTDFGIAKAQRKREQTAAGVIKGKVAYMSPEQALGTTIDRRSDIFSVGSALYRMVTEKLPFEAADDMESLIRVQKAEFTPPEQVKPTVGPGVSSIIMRAMRLAPSERYQTIGKRRLEATTTSSIVKDRMGTDLSAGTSFELDDVEKEKERGTAPTEYAMPSRPDLAPRPLGGSTAQVSATARRPRRRSGFMFGVIFALAIVAGLLYAKNWAEQKGVIGALGLGGDTGEKGPPADSPAPTTQAPSPPAPNPTATGTTAPAPPTAPPAPPSAPVVAAGVADAAAHAAPPPAPNPVAQAPAADARAPVAENHPTEDKATPPAPPTTADKTDKQAGQAAQAGQAGQAGKDEDDEPDEEALLRDAVPNAEEAVIGEEEAEAPPAPKPGAKKQPPPKQKAPPPKQAAAEKPSPPPAPAKPQTAVLHITSAPAGAIVRTKARVLGRTPINLHFKTGNTYELKLVKRGYTPATRKVAVNNAKDRKIAVKLKKKPAPRKHASFFHPHR